MAKMLRTSLLITNRGMLEAYRVKVGDNVLCADGRFRVVESVEKSKGKVVELKGHGHPKLWVPEDQGILSTSYKAGANGREFKPFSFKTPDLMQGRFWGSPERFPLIDGILSEEEAWLVGLAMASGTVSGRNPILIYIHESNREVLEGKLKKMNLKFFQTSIHTQFEYQINAPKLLAWMSKTIPQTLNRRMVPMEVLCGPRNIQKSFFEGYLFGKGTIEPEKYRVSMNNGIEAISIKLLSQALFYSTAMYLKETIVEKKTSEYWQVVSEKTARSSVRIGRNRWGLVRKSESIPKDKSLVSIEVQGNQSLIVDGIIFQ